MTSQHELLQAILYELDLPYRGMQEGEMRLSLIDQLAPGRTRYEAMLLIVDEAHSLPPKLFEELRQLTNLVRDGVPLVRLVLAGSSALEERFAHPKLASFNQRLAARCYLDCLTSAEALQFVRAQTAAAGGDPDACWTEDALRAIHRLTGGVPRLINQVCDHALILAAAGGVRNIDDRGVEEAWADLQQLPMCGADEPTLQATNGESTVIEFGSLDDDDDSSLETAPLPAASAGSEAADESRGDSAQDTIAVTVDNMPASSSDTFGAKAGEPASCTDGGCAIASHRKHPDEVHNVEVDPPASGREVDDGASANEVILREYAGLEADNVVQLSPSMRPLSVSSVDGEEDNDDKDDASAHWQSTLRGVIEHRAACRAEADCDVTEMPSEEPESIGDVPAAEVHTTDTGSDAVQDQQFVTMSTVMTDQPQVEASRHDADTLSASPADQGSGGSDAADPDVHAESAVEFAPTTDVRSTDVPASADEDVARSETVEVGAAESEPVPRDETTVDDATSRSDTPSAPDTDRVGEHPLIPVRPREYRQLFAKLRNRHAS
jgi:hypothetical protein